MNPPYVSLPSVTSGAAFVTCFGGIVEELPDISVQGSGIEDSIVVFILRSWRGFKYDVSSVDEKNTNDRGISKIRMRYDLETHSDSGGCALISLSKSQYSTVLCPLLCNVCISRKLSRKLLEEVRQLENKRSSL